MEKTKKKQSGIPLIVIGAVLVAAVMLFAWCANKPTKPVTNGTPTPAPVKTVSNVPQPGAQPPNFLGSPNASVTVEEFADFQCPSCGAEYPTMKEIQSIFGPRIKFIFRNFPLPMHDKAYDAAVAAEAAGMQGTDKFWAMHSLLYTNQKSWSADPNYKQTFKDYAEKIGLDADRWQTDMAGMVAKSRVDADLQRGKALEIGSTPTLFINGKNIPFEQMNVPTLQKYIEDELKAAQAQQPAAPQSNTAPNNQAAAPKK
jgi:protein-disulfide isomerase